MAVGDDPFDAKAGLLEDRLDQFLGQTGGEIREEVGKGGHLFDGS